MRIRNNIEIIWGRLPRESDSESNRPAPKNKRQQGISQRLYGQPPRRNDRLILEVGE